LNVATSIVAAVCVSALMLGLSLLVWMPGLALGGLVRSFRDSPVLRLAAIPLGTSAAGWIVFWAWFASPTVGYLFSAAVMVMSVVLAVRYPGCLTDRDVRYPLAFAVLLCTGFLCIAGDRGRILDGPWMVSNRYWATLDNDLPRVFAEELVRGRATLPEWLCCLWKLSDRPPLQSGVVLIALPFFTLKYRLLAYLMLSIAANGLWIFGLWAFLAAVDLRPREIAWSILAVSLVGAAYINTVYTWPKMLAGGLTVAAAATVFVKTGSSRARSLGCALLAAFSMLAHGASAFGLLGLLVAGQRQIRGWGLRNCIVAGVVAVACYIPWMGFQKFVNPPGDRLIKYHLAGTSIVDIDPRPPLEAIVASYREIGLAGTLQNKLTNVRLLMSDPTLFADWRNWQPRWKGTWPNELRVYLDHKTAAAPGLLLVGVLALIWRRDLRKRRWARTMGVLVVATAAAFVVIEFGTEFSSTWLISGPYSLFILWCALGAVALVESRRAWAYGVLAAHAASFLFLWVIHVPAAVRDFRRMPLGVGMQVSGLATAAGIAYLMTRLGHLDTVRHPAPPESVRVAEVEAPHR
jgi:hypothetical protein